MTRKERHDRLKEMWKKIPYSVFGVTSEAEFFRWQGMTAALLGFNPHLQSEFRDIIKSVSEGRGRGGSINSPCKPNFDRFLTVLSEAINELSLPEEMAVPILTDEHGIWWFINHCTWKSRLTFFGMLAGVAFTIFVIGFKVGTTEWARNLYREYMTLPTPAPTPAPTATQPTK